MPKRLHTVANTSSNTALSFLRCAFDGALFSDDAGGLGVASTEKFEGLFPGLARSSDNPLSMFEFWYIRASSFTLVSESLGTCFGDLVVFLFWGEFRLCLKDNLGR